MFGILSESLFIILVLTGKKESFTKLYESFEDTHIFFFGEVFAGDVDG